MTYFDVNILDEVTARGNLKKKYTVVGKIPGAGREEGTIVLSVDGVEHNVPFSRFVQIVETK